MKNPFKKGDLKHTNFEVKQEDIAQFESGVVHEVCSTFRLAQEMEWVARQFVLEMKEEGEEGIGTRLELKHINPAFVGEKIELEAIYNDWINNELICDVIAKVGDRVICAGYTGQKVLNREILTQRFDQIRN